MFAYDANGNRSSLTEDAVLYAYSNLANSNQLLSTTGPQPKTYSYDLAGNVTGDGVHTYGYDDRGRLIDVDAGAATYTYNGQGQRDWRVKDGRDPGTYINRRNRAFNDRYPGPNLPGTPFRYTNPKL